MRYRLILLIFIGVAGCSSSHFTMKDKYLVYSMNRVMDNDFLAPFFYYYRSDTVYKFESSFGSKDEVILIDDSNNFKKQWIAPKADLRYTVLRKKKDVYYSYNRQGNFVLVKMYSLNPKDTTFIKIMSPNNHAAYDKTVYTGKDTIVNFYGNKIKCLKFIEFPAISQYNTVVYRYLHKNTFLPIIVDEYYYKGNYSNLIGRNTYILRFTLDSNEVNLN